MNDGMIGFFIGYFFVLFIIVYSFMVIDSLKIKKYRRFLTDTKQWQKFDDWEEKREEQQRKARY